MNRQVRRIEEKKERQQERDKAKLKAQRQSRRRDRRQERERATSARDAKKSDAAAGNDLAKDGGTTGGKKAGSKPVRRGSDPGRFSGALMIATMFFILLQAVTPTDGGLASQAVAASFYLLFGYFAVLWLMRRRTERAVVIAIAIGLALGVGTGLSQWLQPALEIAPLMLALIAPLLIAGAFLGRVVYLNAPG